MIKVSATVKYNFFDTPDKNKTRQKRHTRVRGKISGTAECPRLNVYRSNKNIYAQVIDDVAGVTLVSALSFTCTEAHVAIMVTDDH